MALLPEMRIYKALKGRGKTLALAESCTGGLASQKITSVPGSSDYFDRGLVTYSNRAKTELLGVSEEILAAHGAVSGECAEAMVRGILEKSGAFIAGAITGVAGPDGGTEQKPVGTVWIAWGTRERIQKRLLSLFGSRGQIRESSANALLSQIAILCEEIKE